ncbi:MAG: flavodoxin domain-containing protein [Pseudomonadota bacterium]
MKISLLYGTETGNAEMLCEDLQSSFRKEHDVKFSNLEDIGAGELEKDRFHMFFCSTYGDGELPNSAIDFVDALKADKNDLSGIKFSIFGLGDTSYDETYNNGSKVLMDALTEAGAEMVGPRGLHDASGFDNPEDIAEPWAKERMAEVAAHYT